DEDFWAARFAHEIRTCKAFSEHPPPVRVPRLVHADSHRVLVVEQVPGTVVDTERYPEHSLDEATVDASLAAVTGFARWTPPPGALQPVFDLADRVERYHHQGWFTDTDRDALHALLRQLPAPAAPAHGDPLPANLLRTENGTVALLDFEFTGLFLPGFDLAMLHTLLAATPGAQQRIEELVTEQG
ncbi:phosphotransferase, partial [Saccharopolyspora griseoalba]